MKIKHIWSVLCKESVINQDDNNLSIYGAIEELSVTLTPTDGQSKLPEKISIPVNYEIVSLWFKDKKDMAANGEIEYILISPEGKELFKTVQNIEMLANIRRFRSRMKISGMPITKEGDYSFKIRIKEAGEKTFHLVSELPLEVKIKLETPKAK